MRTFLTEAVDQLAGIIDQRILHRIRGDDDDDKIAAIAPLAQQHAWPAAAACRLMFRLFDDLGFFQLSGDRRNGGRRQPGEIGYFGMRERTVATQHGQHEHAVSLPDQLRARFGQHGSTIMGWYDNADVNHAYALPSLLAPAPSDNEPGRSQPL